MREMYERFKYRFISVSQDNSGVAAVEVILILVDILILYSICVYSLFSS